MGTLKLYTSHRLESLTDKLADVVARPMSSPLQPEVIIVQSQGMARWLRLELAARHGICANYSFPLSPGCPDGFAEFIATTCVQKILGKKERRRPISVSCVGHTFAALR
jgi:exodeoxyribonuclease V gamma subunit